VVPAGGACWALNPERETRKQELKKEIAKLRRHNAHLQSLASRSSGAFELEDHELADEPPLVGGGARGSANVDKQLQHGGLPPAGPDSRASREGSGRVSGRGGGGAYGDG